MRIDPKDVEHVARLAMLDLAPGEVETLAAQLTRIVDYVGQLEAVTADEAVPAWRGGPAAAPLRPDEVRPVPLAREPDAIAPEMRQGFFVVPRLGHLEAE